METKLGMKSSFSLTPPFPPGTALGEMLGRHTSEQKGQSVLRESQIKKLYSLRIVRKSLSFSFPNGGRHGEL